jgi:hypothetical protein
VNPKAGLDVLEERKFLTLPGFELQSLGRPARSQSLYRLRYFGSLWSPVLSFKNRGETLFEKYNGNFTHGLIRTRLCSGSKWPSIGSNRKYAGTLLHVEFEGFPSNDLRDVERATSVVVCLLINEFCIEFQQYL